MVVFDDADPAAVAEGIKIAGYWNSGQDCTAGSRVIAGPKIYDALLEELVPAGRVAQGRRSRRRRRDRDGLGDLEGAAGAHPRLPRAGEGRDRADRAAARTATRGFFVQPTIVTDVAADDEIVQKRGVRPGRHRAAVRRRRRGDRLGERRPLRAGGVGLDARRRPRPERGAQLQFGTVWINDHLLPITSEMPHGGYKQSGYGKDMSVVLDGGVHPDQARRDQARLSNVCDLVATKSQPGCAYGRSAWDDRRPLVAGGIYHVTPAGNAREAVFRDEVDYMAFLRRLGEASRASRGAATAYCLLAEPLPPAARDAGAEPLGGHAPAQRFVRAAFNARHDRVGHVFQGRYGAQLIARGLAPARGVPLHRAEPGPCALCDDPRAGPGRATARSLGSSVLPRT